MNISSKRTSPPQVSLEASITLTALNGGLKPVSRPVQVATPLIAVPAGSAFGLPVASRSSAAPGASPGLSRSRTNRQLGTFRNGRWAGYRLTTGDVYLILPHQLELRLRGASKPAYWRVHGPTTQAHRPDFTG